MKWKRPIAKLFGTNRRTAKMLAAHDLTKRASWLVKVGWFESVYQRAAVNGQGEAIPWITYAATAFMEPRLRTEMAVFEYGSGNSTIWWANRVARVVSCEHDAAWHQKMSPHLPDNVEYVFAELNDGYVGVIARHEGEFDIVVIDGRERVRCADKAIDALKGDGVMIWDNSDRDKYQSGYALLHDRGFRRIDFWGAGPIVAYGWCTSVFYRANNCLRI